MIHTIELEEGLFDLDGRTLTVSGPNSISVYRLPKPLRTTLTWTGRGRGVLTFASTRTELRITGRVADVRQVFDAATNTNPPK